MAEPTRKQRDMLATMADTPCQSARYVGAGLWHVTDGHSMTAVYGGSVTDALVDAGMLTLADHGTVAYLTRQGADYLARWPLAEDTAERTATLAGPDAEPTDAERATAERRARLAAVLADYHATPRADVAGALAALADALTVAEDAARDAGMPGTLAVLAVARAAIERADDMAWS